MTAHLEAHEGNNHYLNRNKNLAEILGGAKPDPNYNMHDASIISHHMFICGDLNYRIHLSGVSNDKDTEKRSGSTMALKHCRKMSNNMATKLAGALTGPFTTLEGNNDENSQDAPTDTASTSSANGSHFAQAKALVEKEKWKELNDCDELVMALGNKECLAGFTTLPCNFPPTFKVERAEGFKYNKKRMPRREQEFSFHHLVPLIFRCIFS